MIGNIHPKVTGATVGAALGTILMGLFGSKLPSPVVEGVPIILAFLGGYLPAGANS